MCPRVDPGIPENARRTAALPDLVMRGHSQTPCSLRAPVAVAGVVWGRGLRVCAFWLWSWVLGPSRRLAAWRFSRPRLLCRQLGAQPGSIHPRTPGRVRTSQASSSLRRALRLPRQMHSSTSAQSSSVHAREGWVS